MTGKELFEACCKIRSDEQLKQYTLLQLIALLMVESRDDPPSRTEMRQAMNISPPSLDKVIERLALGGLVESESGPRATIRLKTTPKGASVNAYLENLLAGA